MKPVGSLTVIDPSVRDFVLLRYVLIIAVSYLVVSQRGTLGVSPTSATLIAGALASNVALGWLRLGRLSTWQIAGVIVLLDTGWISASFALMGQVSTEFFFLYFFVLFFAALAENFLLMLLGVIGASAAYLWVLGRLYPGSTWQREHLLQIAFLFSAALFYGVLVSRTRLHRRRAELIEANDQARTEMLASLAHDIGGPAHVITGGVEALKFSLDNDMSGETRSLFSMVARNSHYLNQLVHDFMEYARLRAGRWRLHPTELALNAVIERVAAQHELDARARGVGLTLALAPIPPVLVDELAVVRILENLIANALRHCGKGDAVVIETAPEPDGIRITVGDSGPGLAPELRAEIGQAFADTPRVHGGVGLGLFIVRTLVEAHGGSLTLESEEGKGARFTIRLPLAAQGSLSPGPGAL